MSKRKAPEEEGVYKTKSGKVLTAAQIEALAAQIEEEDVAVGMDELDAAAAEAESQPEPTGATEPELSGVSAERDPIERMDMSAELEELRKLFHSRGWVRKASSGEGEVWERPMAGNPGYKAILIADQGGRLRCELRNPVGAQMAVINPAYPKDVELALPF